MIDSTVRLRISTIIPVYNGARYLREAIVSVQSQTLSPDEIIVIDDASSDETPTLIAELAADDPRIRHTRLPMQSGAGAGRNHGVSMATGDLLSFLDADDLWMPDALAIQAETLRGNARIDITFGCVQQFFSPDLDARTRESARLDEAPRTALLPGGMMIRRSTFEQVGAFRTDVRVGEFVDWYIRARRLFLHEKMLPAVTLRRRIHRDNLTRAGALHSDYARILKASLDDQRALPTLIPTLRAIFDTGIVTAASGEAVTLRAHVDESSCYVLQYLLRMYRPTRIVEVGFAYGISALAMLSMVAQVDHLVYHIIDPHQTSFWQAIGIENVRRAGYDGKYNLHLLPSEIVLPWLLTNQQRLDFAFIDGNHTFDHVLVDFFYVNKMLDIGGVVVFDDVQMESQARLMKHIATYPAYERINAPESLVVDGVRRPIDNPARFGVFRKVADDLRQWDWHADF
ncbi:MAG: glycosyltransferase [Chloroflexota bacterium]|nr:glycosyltransferase [Chloroflexota bacterium]